MCQNERKCMPIAQRKVELKDGNYQTSLPFQDRQAPEPTNKAQAWQGAIWLRKKLERDPKQYQDYKTFMAGTLPKRYARKLSPDQKSLAKDNA